MTTCWSTTRRSASHHIHHLNAVSAAIWRLCDGQRSVDEIADAASDALGDDVSAETVRFALGKLAEARLLAGSPGNGASRAGQSRRSFLRKAAVAGAVAVPAVVSISAPSAAAQTSPRYCGLCPQLGASCTCDDDGSTGFCWTTDGTANYCYYFYV